MSKRGHFIGLAGLALAVSCGATDSPEGEPPESGAPEAPLHCGAGPTARGSWTTLRQPEEVLTLGATPGVVFSDGSRLWTTNGRWLGTLEPGAWEWSVSETVPTAGAWNLVEWTTSAGGEWLFGWFIDGSSLTLETLDLTAGSWTSHAIPEEIAENLGFGEDWVAGELAVPLFDFRTTASGEELTLGVALFDPERETWREAPVERIAAYSIVESPLYTPWASDWIDTTLYQWGPLRDGSAVYMRSFDVETETWSTLPTDGGPGVRLGAGMLADEQGHLFVHGGFGPGEARPALRELWRFDLDTRAWSQLEVPEWVDPALGAVLDGKLYFLGGCTTGAVYDPIEDSWRQLPALAALDGASGTQLRVAGGRLAVTGIFYHPHTHVPDVFLFDPSGSRAVNVAGAGGR